MLMEGRSNVFIILAWY